MYEEPQKENDLFYTCSLIEFIARQTKNEVKDIVNILGKEKIKKIYELAEIYHCENIEKVANDLIIEADIKDGKNRKIEECKYRVPTHWEIGKIYRNLIIMVNSNENEYIDTLMEVLSSWIIKRIDNYNSSMYYSSAEYIYECYREGKVL